jgi:hypothetical protein
MPTPAEISAAVAALHERRERSRLSNGPWPKIEEEVRIVLEAAEGVRPVERSPGALPKSKIIPDEKRAAPFGAAKVWEETPEEKWRSQPGVTTGQALEIHEWKNEPIHTLRRSIAIHSNPPTMVIKLAASPSAPVIFHFEIRMPSNIGSMRETVFCSGETVRSRFSSLPSSC